MGAVTADADRSTNRFADARTRSELLGQLAGAASTCWEHVDRAGTFDSTRAADLVVAALDRLIELDWPATY